MSAFPPESAAARGLAVCHVCGKLSRAPAGRCARCGASLHLRKADRLHRTVALLVTAALLYVPANLLPISRLAERPGILSRTTSEIELVDIRNVQVHQGAIDRLLGIGSYDEFLAKYGEDAEIPWP